MNFALLALISVLTASIAFAHQGHHHAHTGGETKTLEIRKEEAPAMNKIRDDYKRRIEPIFQKSCMDCHSAQTRYPWYHKIPGIKQMLDSDIKEAREHLDLSNGYPFKSHASPTEDLDAIAESVQKETMPPFSYRLMHPGAALTHEEKAAILDWVEKSRPLLKQ